MTTRARVNRVLAVVLVLWGGGMVVSAIVRGQPTADTAYSGGQVAALALGVVALIAGVRTLRKKQPG